MSEGFVASVHELLAMLRANEGRLPYEIGAFIALQACEAIQGDPRRLDASNVRITANGEVELHGAETVDEAVAAMSVVQLLSALMVAARSEVPPAFVRILERSIPTDLRRLRDEIEAGLLPLNRGASKRVLARQIRDLLRGDRPQPSSRATRDVDASLDAWLGILKHDLPTTPEPEDRAKALLEAPDPLLEGIEEEKGRSWLGVGLAVGVLIGLLAAAALWLAQQ